MTVYTRAAVCAAASLLMAATCTAPVDAALSMRRVLNTALAGPGESSVVPSVAGSWPGEELMSAEWLGTLTAPTSGDYVLECAVENAAALLWIDDHLLCGTPELFRDQEELSRSGVAPSASVTEAPLPPFMRLAAGDPHFLRVQLYHNETTASNASLLVKWSHYNSTSLPEPISPAALSATISQAQQTRLGLQRNLARGWGTWWRPSALAATLLPEATTLTAGLCADGACTDPCATFTPENGHGPEEPCAGGRCNLWSVPGIVAWDRSYWQLNVSLHRSIGQDLNVSLEWFGTGSSARMHDPLRAGEEEDELSLLATVTGGDAAGTALTVAADFKFDRAGAVMTSDGSSELRLVAYGLRTVVARPVTPPASSHSSTSPCNTTMLSLPLSSGFAVSPTPAAPKNARLHAHGTAHLLRCNGVGCAQAMTTASGQLPSLSELRSRAAAARARAAFSLQAPTKEPLATDPSVDTDSVSKESLREGGEAMKAGLMWNVVRRPAINGFSIIWLTADQPSDRARNCLFLFILILDIARAVIRTP